MSGPRNFAKFGALRTDLEVAWNDRLKDADVLLAAGHATSAVAMGVYALEILLKEQICQRLDLDQLPRAFEFHDLDGLLVLTGLFRRLNDPDNLAVRMNWDQIALFASLLNDLRYRPSSVLEPRDTPSFFESLREPPHGVIPWILSLR